MSGGVGEEPGPADVADPEVVGRAVRARALAILSVPGLRLTAITAAAAAEVATWTIPPRRVDWPWGAAAAAGGAPVLDLAIWHGAVLCGLARGEPGAGWLDLAYLEGRPWPHPLSGRIMDIALLVLEVQAATLAIPETRIRRPLGDYVLRYRAQGYRVDAFVDGVHYLCKR